MKNNKITCKDCRQFEPMNLKGFGKCKKVYGNFILNENHKICAKFEPKNPTK